LDFLACPAKLTEAVLSDAWPGCPLFLVVKFYAVLLAWCSFRLRWLLGLWI